jgi:hypothetical protein
MLTSRSATPIFRRTEHAIDYKPVMEPLWGRDQEYPSDEGVEEDQEEEEMPDLN